MDVDQDRHRVVVATLMTALFGAHPNAALEYWFFKLNHGQTSLLVDWIARRKASRGSLRISVRSPGGAEVIETDSPGVLAPDFEAMESNHTKNLDGKVRWDLELLGKSVGTASLERRPFRSDPEKG
jgi:hypothetical protein